MLSNFLVFSFSVPFSVPPSCKGEGTVLVVLFWCGFVRFAFVFPLNQLGVFFLFLFFFPLFPVSIDQHIPNKPVSSAHVQF